MNFQPQAVSTVKVRALSGKEWGPKKWNVDIWEDPSKVRAIEPLSSAASFLPGEVVLPLPSENVNPTLPETPVMVSLAVFLVGITDSPHHPILLLQLYVDSCPSRYQSIIHEVHCIPKELHNFSNLYR